MSRHGATVRRAGRWRRPEGAPRPGGRRRLHAPEPQAVTFVELFFDLVFVFAVTQLTQHAAGQLTAGGVARSVLLFWLIWWAWTQLTWTLNPADTRSTVVRATTLAATGAAFVMAASVPRAYGDDPLWFAAPYVVVRLLGLWLQVRVDLERDGRRHGAVVRWAVASCAVLVVVLAGAAVDPSARPWFWLVAVAGDLAAASYAGRGHTWDIDPAHFCERHGLFVIIALGESLILAGSAVAAEDRSPALTGVAGATLLVACLLWWTYFGWLKEALEEGLAAAPAERVGTLARDAFSLGHFALVCGIVGFAVAVEEILAHPDEAPPGPVVAALVTGIALFVGFSAFAYWRLHARVLGRRLVLVAATLIAVVAVSGWDPVWPLAATVAGLAATVVVEGGSGPAGGPGRSQAPEAAVDGGGAGSLTPGPAPRPRAAPRTGGADHRS